MKAAFLLTLSFLQMSCHSQRSIEKIQDNDRVQLEQFFQHLLWSEQFAYTLFGNKPLSIIGCKKILPNGEIVGKNLQFYHVLIQYWNVWKKYESLFPMHDYVLLAKEDENWIQIMLINRRSCLETISAHLDLFQEALDSKLTPNELLDQIIASKDLFRHGLKNHYSLYGLLLGYGLENAMGFEELYSKKMGLPKKPIPFHEDDVLLPLKLHLPFFMVFSDNTKHNDLKRKYEEQRELIVEHLKNDKHDFLDVVLARLSRL